MPKIAIYHKDYENPVTYLSRIAAEEMVAYGIAVRISKCAIKMTIPAQKSPIRCGQEAVYESAGIDKHPVFFNGGLTRTETQPAKFQSFKAARVAH